MSQATVDRWLADAERAPSPGRRVVMLVSLVGLVLSAIGGWLAWRSYQDRATREGERVAEAALEAARASESFLADRIAVLESISRLGSVRQLDLASMMPLLQAMSSDDLGFSGGVGWADADGVLRVEAGTGLELLLLDVTERRHITGAVETGAPFVSGGLRQRLGEGEMFLMAVPTLSEGELTGMLLASILIERLATEVPLLAQRGLDTRVVDRTGAVMLENGAPADLEPPPNPGLLAEPGGEVMLGRGLMGEPDRIVALSRVDLAGWSIVVEQAQDILLAEPRNRFVAELVVLASLTLLAIGAAVLAGQRLNLAHREMVEEARDLRALEALSETLAVAPGVEDVAESARLIFSDVFDTPTVMIGLLDESGAGLELVAGGSPDQLDLLSLEDPTILTDAFRLGETLLLDADEYRGRDPVLAPDQDISGAIAGRFRGRNAAGAVGVVLYNGFPPPRSHVELFEAMVPLLGDAFGRAVAMEGERRASRVFQQALLPRDTIGHDVPLQRAVRYLPAVGDVEVGGDWYDLWMIEEDRIGMVVGDVVGRGVEAAAAMGQLRSALRATVVTTDSVGAALTRLDEMTNQVPGTPSATVVLGSLDLSTGIVSLASAGHLPPMLTGRDGVRVLYEVRGAPIGFVEQTTDRLSLMAKVPLEETIVLYSDGLVERRGESIDDGIERLRASITAHEDLGVEALADAILAHCLEERNPDDVALVCIRPVGSTPRHFTRVTPLADASTLREDLRIWLEARGTPPRRVHDVLTRLRSAISVIAESVGDDRFRHDVMVEADAEPEVTSVAVELRRSPIDVDRKLEARIIEQWGSGAIAPAGPRLQFSSR